MVIAGRRGAWAKAFSSLADDVAKRFSDDLSGIRSTLDLSRKVRGLQEQIEKLEIEKGRKDEEFARKEREVEHKVGLERKRSEFEVVASKREAILSVKEENLAADRKRFEDQMEFHERRFSEEVGYLKAIIGELAERLPSLSMTAKLGGAKRGPSK